MAEKTSGSSGSGASATAEREKAQSKTDNALQAERRGGQSTKDEKRHGVERDSDGNVQPLEYPETEVQDTVTYRDPRPLDWPQKADRSVFVGAVHQVDPDEDVKGDYVDNAGLLDEDELELGGDVVNDLQVVAGSGQITLIVNGKAFVAGPLAGALQADLGQALLLNSNS